MSSNNEAFGSNTRSISGGGHFVHFFEAATQVAAPRFAMFLFGVTAMSKLATLGIGAAGGIGALIIGEATHYGLRQLGMEEVKATVIASIVQAVAFVVITGLIAAPILGGIGAGMLFAIQCLAGMACLVAGIALVYLLGTIGKPALECLACCAASLLCCVMLFGE